MNYHLRLEALIKRRIIAMDDIKYRGKLRTVKWMTYEASPKRHLFDSYLRGIQ